MKKMKILFLQTFPFYGSGSGTYVRYLAKELNKTHRVAVLAPDTRPINGVKIYTLKLPFHPVLVAHPEWKDGILYENLTNSQILKLHETMMSETVNVVEDFKPDIIHVQHAFPLSWSARFVKMTYQIPYVITGHGSELPIAQKDKRYRLLTADALRGAFQIMPNSTYTKDWMFRVFGEEYRKQMRVIPGGVDVNRFKKVSASKIDKELNLKGKKVVLFAGRLTSYKGVKYLVKAAKRINGEILISGDGPERKNLEEMIKKEHIKNVRILGHLGDDTDYLIQLYSRANVFVAPSIWDEPLGLVILESMACETPVVVTRKGGIPLAVKDGKNGFFVKARNATDIALKVNKLLENEGMRIKMGKNARKIAIDRFSWEKISLKFSHIYEKALS